MEKEISSEQLSHSGWTYLCLIVRELSENLRVADHIVVNKALMYILTRTIFDQKVVLTNFVSY